MSDRGRIHVDPASGKPVDPPKWVIGVWPTPECCRRWQAPLLRGALAALRFVRHLDLAERAETWLARKFDLPGDGAPDPIYHYGWAIKDSEQETRRIMIDRNDDPDDMHFLRLRQSQWSRWWLKEVISAASPDQAATADGSSC